QVQEHVVRDRAIGLLDMARPLERDLLVGSRTGPYALRKIDGLEIEVVARVPKSSHHRGGCRIQEGPLADGYFLHTPMQRSGKPRRRNLTQVQIAFLLQRLG